MYFADFGKGVVIDRMDESNTNGAKYASLHTDFSSTGSNELTGGTPAYARQAITWLAAAGGQKQMTSDVTFDVPPTTSIFWVGLWDDVSAGHFLGMTTAGGSSTRPCSVENATDMSNNDIFVQGHGFTTDTRVVFWGSIPGGLTIGVAYYVLATGLTLDSFRVSSTSAGATVALTGTPPFAFFVQVVVPATSVGQTTYLLAAGSISMALLA